MAWTRTLVSGRYQGLYRDQAGRVRTAPGGPFVHKKAAERAASAAEAESRKAGWRSPDAARSTWGEWCASWWPTRDVETSTLKSDAGRRDKHLLPRWGTVPLGDITRHDVRAWASDLREGRGTAAGRPLATDTVLRCVYLFSASLVAAVDAEVLDSNPAARLRLGGGKPSAERYLTREEYAAVREQLHGEYGTMADLLVATGMRWSEAAGLHSHRVDTGRGVITVAEVWSLRGRSIKPYPKGRRRRDVPLPGWVTLEPTAATSCGYPHDVGSRCRSGLVVTTEAGAMVDQSKFAKVWAAAVRAAGIGHVRPHDLRHTYASWLLQAGVPLAEVGRLLGHVSPTTTQRYAHLAEMPSESVLDALQQPRRAADVQQTPAPKGYQGLRIITGGKGA